MRWMSCDTIFAPAVGISFRLQCPPEEVAQERLVLSVRQELAKVIAGRPILQLYMDPCCIVFSCGGIAPAPATALGGPPPGAVAPTTAIPANWAASIAAFLPAQVTNQPIAVNGSDTMFNCNTYAAAQAFGCFMVERHPGIAFSIFDIATPGILLHA